MKPCGDQQRQQQRNRSISTAASPPSRQSLPRAVTPARPHTAFRQLSLIRHDRWLFPKSLILLTRGSDVLVQNVSVSRLRLIGRWPPGVWQEVRQPNRYFSKNTAISMASRKLELARLSALHRGSRLGARAPPLSSGPRFTLWRIVTSGPYRPLDPLRRQA
jgi:hypothetical protein